MENGFPSVTFHVCIFGFKGASTSKVIGARNEMMRDDYDGQMIFRELVGLKLPDIRLTGEEKPRKNLTQETCPERGSNPGPLRDKRACYHLFHSGGPHFSLWCKDKNPRIRRMFKYSNTFIRKKLLEQKGVVSWALS